MIEVNLFDNAFRHTKDIVGVLTSTYKYAPTKLKWIEREMEFDGITIFTEDMIFNPIVDEVKSKIKIAWIYEPPAINSTTYENIITYEDKFDYILTYSDALLKRSPKYLKYIIGQSRVSDDDIINTPLIKEPKVSMIASNKTMSDGHRFRHEVIQSLHGKHKFELWGTGYRYFNEKVEVLPSCQYSICVMNSKFDNFFTEVLLDCFRLRVVPIFWGASNIGEYFDLSGMLIFNTIEELDLILSNLPPYSIFEAGMNNNFELCKQYNHTDDYIAEILNKL